MLSGREFEVRRSGRHFAVDSARAAESHDTTSRLTEPGASSSSSLWNRFFDTCSTFRTVAPVSATSLLMFSRTPDFLGCTPAKAELEADALK